MCYSASSDHSFTARQQVAQKINKKWYHHDIRGYNFVGSRDSYEVLHGDNVKGGAYVVWGGDPYKVLQRAEIEG